MVLKNVAHRVFDQLGLRITKKSNIKKLPVPTIDNVKLIIELFTRFKQQITILQIGACDGYTSDSIFHYIQLGAVDAYLVEPSKTNFAKLKEFYQGFDKVKLINAAVAESDEEKKFYSIKDEGRWRDNGWARQLASFYKVHLLKHGIGEHEIQEELVSCFTLKTLIKEYQIGNLDILLMDTEGYDGEIVKMAISQNILPNFIAFENVHLVKTYSQFQLDVFYELLETNGYVWTHDRINTLAIRRDFFLNQIDATGE